MTDYNIKTSQTGTVRHSWEKDGYELVMMVRPGSGTLFHVDGPDNGIELHLDGLVKGPEVKLSVASTGAMDAATAVEFAEQIQKVAEVVNLFQKIVDSFMQAG